METTNRMQGYFWDRPEPKTGLPAGLPVDFGKKYKSEKKKRGESERPGAKSHEMGS